MSAVSRIAVTTTTAIAITAMPSMRPIRSTSTWSGVRCSRVRPRRRATVPHLRRHPRRGHDRTPTTARNGGTTEDHVHAVAELDRAVERRDVLQHRLALPRQRRLGDGQRAGLKQTAVRGDRVTLHEQQHIAGHDLGRGDPLLAPVAEHAGRRRGQPLQCGHRLLGTRLLHVAEHGIREHDRGDHDRVVRRSLASLQQPRRPARPRPPRAAGRSAGSRTAGGASATPAPAPTPRADSGRTAPVAPWPQPGEGRGSGRSRAPPRPREPWRCHASTGRRGEVALVRASMSEIGLTTSRSALRPVLREQVGLGCGSRARGELRKPTASSHRAHSRRRRASWVADALLSTPLADAPSAT